MSEPDNLGSLSDCDVKSKAKPAVPLDSSVVQRSSIWGLISEPPTSTYVNHLPLAVVSTPNCAHAGMQKRSQPNCRQFDRKFGVDACQKRDAPEILNHCNGENFVRSYSEATTQVEDVTSDPLHKKG